MNRWDFHRVSFSAALGLLLAACCLPPSAVHADEADTAALKAEMQVLKDRLAKLERQLSSSTFTGASGIGEKPSPALLELPSGLRGLGISGYADVAYTFNFAEPKPTRVTRGRAFDNEPNGFTPHAFELVLEKSMDDSMPIGFRTDLVFGDDAEVVGLSTTGLGLGTDELDIQQLYITAKAPIGDGIDFKLGKFVTLLGAEVIESPANWNYSRSFMFNYSIPFTHTGALATYPLGELGSVTAGVVNGWDNPDDNNTFKSMIGNVTVTPVEDVTLGVNAITGAEVATDNRNDRTVLDFVGTWKPLEELTLMANYDFGYQSAGRTTSFDTREWAGLALYAKYDFTPTWSLAGRWEWFDDKDGFRTGLSTLDGTTPTDVDFYGYTLTSQWKLHEHVLARLEYRHDKADENVFFHDGEDFIDYQDTIAAELIYHF